MPSSSTSSPRGVPPVSSSASAPSQPPSTAAVVAITAAATTAVLGTALYVYNRFIAPSHDNSRSQHSSPSSSSSSSSASAATHAQRLLHRQASRKDSRSLTAVTRVSNAFQVSTDLLNRISAAMQDEMKRGLAKEGGSNLKMLPSHVHWLPTGKESGQYLALDLGGSNFRVLLLTLDGKGGCSSTFDKYVLSKELMTGPGEQLFDFIADSVKAFLQKQNVTNVLPLGFTFSFPVQQHALNSGSLIRWTKGFHAAGVEGQDVAKLLNAAFERKSVKADVVAIVNDTVGTQIARCLDDHNCYIGLILGTGSNACYLENLKDIPKWDGERKEGQVIINIEWGAFDDDRKVLPLTMYDVQLDDASLNQGQQTFEKMISGMYLGEITRLVMLELAQNGELFEGYISDKLKERYALKTAVMSDIESDDTEDYSITRDILAKELEMPSAKISLADRDIVRQVCEIVSTRAARLAAAGIAAIATKIDKTHDCTVAVDGTLFQKYPNFESRINQALSEIFYGRDNVHIVFKRSEDGSGKGAALIAALAKKH